MTIITKIDSILDEFANILWEYDTTGKCKFGTKIANLNSFAILSKKYEIDDYEIMLISMRNTNGGEFETPLIFSRIMFNEIQVVKASGYVIDGKVFDCVMYDKSEFFNKSVLGELKTTFNYEWYELFKNIHSVLLNKEQTTYIKNIQIGIQKV